MRVSGITIPDNKRLEVGLTVIFGVGQSRARQILSSVGLSKDKLAKDLTTEEENKIRDVLKEYTLEGDLKREVSSNVKRLKDIQSYRGSRHARNLPTRGQRTKTNSRTAHGNTRRTMGSGRRKIEKK